MSTAHHQVHNDASKKSVHKKAGVKEKKLNSRSLVLAHAGRKGTKVGSGECFDLADQALKDAGAKSAGDYGPVTPESDYRWGKPAPHLTQNSPAQQSVGMSDFPLYCSLCYYCGA